MVFGQRRVSRCEQMRALFSDLVDQRLPEEKETAVREHLVTCAACAEQLSEFRFAVSALRQLPRLPVPRSFQFEAPLPAAARRAPWYYYFRDATGAVAALLVAVVALHYFVSASSPSTMANAPSSVALRESREPAVAAPAASDSAAAGPAVAPFGGADSAPAPAPMREAPAVPVAAAPVAPSAAKAPSDELAAKGAERVAAAPSATAPGATKLAETAASDDQRAARAPSETAETQTTTTPVSSWQILEYSLAGILLVLGVATLIARRAVPADDRL